MQNYNKFRDKSSKDSFFILRYRVPGKKIQVYFNAPDISYYDEVATVFDKRESHTKTEHSFNAEFDFENDEFGNRSIRLRIGSYSQIEIGDKCIFTFQDGFFNIPVIREIKIVKQ